MRCQYSADPQVFVDRALRGDRQRLQGGQGLDHAADRESLNSIAAYRYTERMMAALREAVGDDVDIMVDCHGRHFPANALEFCRVLGALQTLLCRGAGAAGEYRCAGRGA